ncbi:MAG: hypothetical protein K0S19_746 [Geminicoccaceae bacterium]|nr:hypothetical protein [Geminicoccaceae bacterium]
MSKLPILAAMAAVSLACHNRAEDEVGAAPEQTDTTAVTHVIDSTRTGPPGVGGRPGNATVTPDSVGVDSAVTTQDTTGGIDTTLTSTPQDTLGPQDTGVQDTSAMQHDSTMMHGDSAMTGHPVPDTTSSQ